MGHRNSTFRCPCLKNRTIFHNQRYCIFEIIVVTLSRILVYYVKTYNNYTNETDFCTYFDNGSTRDEYA